MYFLPFIDLFSGKVWVYVLKKKYDTFYFFNKFIDSVDYQKESKIRCLRTDNGGEYTSNEFKDFCSEHYLDRKYSIADTPQ